MVNARYRMDMEWSQSPFWVKITRLAECNPQIIVSKNRGNVILNKKRDFITRQLSHSSILHETP